MLKDFKTALKNTQLFESLSENQMDALCAGLQIEKFNRGDLIIEEGTVGDRLYIVLSGVVRVFTHSKEGEIIVLARLEDGQYFGEQALINKIPIERNASVIALTEVETLAIGYDQFQQCIKSNEQLYQALKKYGQAQLNNKLNQIERRKARVEALPRLPSVEELLGSHLFTFVKITSIREHNLSTRSYRLEPFYGVLKEPKAGQYIEIEAWIDNRWIARNYTLTSIDGDRDHYEITVKNEKEGFFSPWLFNNDKNEILLRVSSPRGNYRFKEEESTPMLFFIAGTGITPVIAFGRTVIAKGGGRQRALHIDYSVHSKEDLLFNEELSTWPEQNRNITIAIRFTSLSGHIQKNEINEALLRFPNADIYICGPKNYEEAITQALKELKASNKIYIEHFIPAKAP